MLRLSVRQAGGGVAGSEFYIKIIILVAFLRID